MSSTQIKRSSRQVIILHDEQIRVNRRIKSLTTDDVQLSTKAYT